VCMVSTVVIQNGATEQQFVAMVDGVRLASKSEPTLCCGDGPQTLDSMVAGARDSTVLMIDANAPIASIQGMFSQLPSVNTVGMTLFSIVTPDEGDRLPALRADTLITALATQRSWPIAAICCDTASLREFGVVESQSMRGLSMKLASHAVGAAIPVDEIVVLSASAPTMFNAATDSERAAALQVAISAANIEDLFPNHAWRIHQEESAAACYHSLAALFIRFGDIETANQCIALSDNFEDSPRSLALKGVIARLRGEALGAVANMVASLQQYELRKTASERHYLSFTPSNLETINSELRAGLQALNKKDNESALSHFSEAVYNFDPFYAQWGVCSPAQ